jgi:rod shape-determining protein MreD
MPAPSTPKQYILLPVNPWFIGFTLVFSLMLNLFPVGRATWTLAWPDWVALTLVFWNIHQPRRVGLTVAWLLGLIMDVNNASLLGEHALAYSVLSYTAISLHRRVLWFSLPTQMVHVLPLLAAAQAVILLIRLAVGGHYPGLLYFSSSLTTVLLWPIVTLLYLAPQRRPAEKDENRPI